MADVSADVFQRLFLRYLISCFGDIAWPALSSDLTADFWLWDHLRENFFVTKPYTLADLKNCVKNKFAATPMSMFAE